MEPQAKMEYDQRFQFFLTQIVNVSRFYPREYYLYRLMDRVAFQDLESGVMNIILDYAKDAQEELIDARKILKDRKQT